MGPTKYAVSYFEKLGFKTDPNSNPADYLLDALCGHVSKAGDPSFRAVKLPGIWREQGRKVMAELSGQQLPPELQMASPASPTVGPNSRPQHHGHLSVSVAPQLSAVVSPIQSVKLPTLQEGADPHQEDASRAAPVNPQDVAVTVTVGTGAAPNAAAANTSATATTNNSTATATATATTPATAAAPAPAPAPALAPAAATTTVNTTSDPVKTTENPLKAEAKQAAQAPAAAAAADEMMSAPTIQPAA